MTARLPPFILIGAGGHARSVIGVIRALGHALLGAVDSDPQRRGSTIDGIPILGDDSYLAQHKPDAISLAIGFGNRPNRGGPGLQPRRSVFERWTTRGFAFPALVSPQAIVVDNARIGAGSIVMPGAMIQAGAGIGDNCIINTGAIVEHDARIGDHSHIAPGAILCGAASVGPESHVGAGAILLQGIRVGTATLVGAGVVIRRDCPDGGISLGAAQP
ncbi:acetyltransferase [Ferrovibrio sp.]|uniref:acetyltransferase n=1 Tax=Ferrovibrio sp. TaxID=1917215 RepID=UPI0026158B26|nr:acetyltransferase [Ferrovibrio sp.]